MGKHVKRETWVTTKMLAEIVGTTERNVNLIRAGKRGKRSLIASKVRYAEKFLEKNIKPHKRNFDKNLQVFIQQAKGVVNSN